MNERFTAVMKHIFVNLDTTIPTTTSSPMPYTGQNLFTSPVALTDQDLSSIQTESSKVSSEDTTSMVDEKRAISRDAIAAIVIGVLIFIILIAIAISIIIPFALQWNNKFNVEPQDTIQYDTIKGISKLLTDDYLN